MLRSIAAPVGLAMAAIAGLSAPAFSDDGGYYTGIRAIGAYGIVDDFSTTGFGGSLQERNTEDPTAGLGLVIGYRYADVPLRAELELSHRFRMDLDLRDLGTPAVGFENNLSTTTAMLNAAYEFRNDSSFTPYIGGGLGWARNHSDVEREVSGSSPVDYSNDKDNLAYAVMGGVTWQFTDNWDVDMGYRYINLGEVDTGDMAGDKITGDYTSHDLMLTVDYRF